MATGRSGSVFAGRTVRYRSLTGHERAFAELAANVSSSRLRKFDRAWDPDLMKSRLHGVEDSLSVENSYSPQTTPRS